jgi:hypothetical protein
MNTIAGFRSGAEAASLIAGALLQPSKAPASSSNDAIDEGVRSQNGMNVPFPFKVLVYSLRRKELPLAVNGDFVGTFSVFE